jgi:type I restriction enzyme S subunit
MSWQVQPLGDACDFQRGLTYEKSDEVAESENVVLRANNIDLNTNHLDLSELRYIRQEIDVPEAKKVKAGSLIVCTASGSKSHLGKVALIDRNYGYAFGGFMGQITPRAGLDPKYLFHLMTSKLYKDFIGALSDGANINNLKFDDLGKFSVPLPDEDEQRRIVAILEEAFAGIATAKANAEKNQQSAHDLSDALIQSLFPHDSKGPAEHTLEELSELIVDCEHKTAPTQDEGIPSIRTPNIGKGKLLLNGVNRVSESTYKAWTRRAEPIPGDLILAREAPAGNVAVIPEGMKVCLGQRTVLIRPKNGVFDSTYLAYLLLQKNSQQRLLAHSRGATVQHINLKDIRAFRLAEIPLLGEQRTVVAHVDDLMAKQAAIVSLYTRKIAALDALKQSLLHQAFSGQL